MSEKNPHPLEKEQNPLYKKQLISQVQNNQPINMIPSNSNNNNNINVNINYNFLDKTMQSSRNKQNPDSNTFLNQEAEALIQRWKAGNFTEFNRWMQISKTDCKVEFSMRNAPNGSKTFVCNMALNFTKNPQINPFFSSGFGKSKKEAKSKAIETILRDLIQKNCLKFGMKTDQIENSNPTENPGSLCLKVLKKNYLNKKLRNLNYEMLELLKQDQFQEACQIYRRLFSLKIIEWRDTFAIWTYVLLKHNLSYVNILLDLMKFSEPSKNQEIPVNPNMSKVNEELMKRYGFGRSFNSNSFEIYDNFNIFLKDVDFVKQTKILNVQDVKDQFISESDPDFVNKLVPYADELIKLPIISENQSALTLLKPHEAYLNQQMSNVKSQMRKESSSMMEEENKGISIKIINSLFDSLIYLGDLCFSLKVAEMIYSNVKISTEDLITPEAGEYFMNKKNSMTLELLESMFQLFSRTKEQKSKIISNVTGSLEKIGEDFSEILLNFAPDLSKEDLVKMICFKRNSEYKENYLQISEGDYVILTSFHENQIDSPVDDTASMKNYLNMFSVQMKANNLEGDAKTLINTINEHGSSFDEALIANVNEISNNYQLKLSILPNKFQLNHIMKSNKIWKLTKLFNKETFDKSSDALMNFVSKSCMSNVLENIILMPHKANKEMQIFPQFYQNFGSYINNNLNSLQNLACTLSFSQPLTLIEGAPGTGKTHLASEIILQWVRQSPLPILACSSTVKGAEILFSKVKQMGLKCIKLGLELDEIQDINKDLLFRQFSTNLTEEQYESLNFKMTKRIISESQVVCCTCLGSGSELLNNMIFTRVLIDEAQQVSEIETLIPLVKKCQQLVLLGDRKKLPPKAISLLAQSKGMSVSMFERLILGGVQPINLVTQYKMHSTISVFPSYHFYNNLLENMNVLEQANGLKIFNKEGQTVRQLWVQIKGEEEVYESSLINRKEIEAAINVVIYLLNNENMNAKNIEIVTLFYAQQYFIRKEIISLAKKKPNLFKLTSEETSLLDCICPINVNVLDDCTLNEKEVVICSTVRCNKEGILGPLKDPRNLNTILTRPKNGLIFLGDYETLGYDSFFNKYINWAKANKIIFLPK